MNARRNETTATTGILRRLTQGYGRRSMTTGWLLPVLALAVGFGAPLPALADEGTSAPTTSTIIEVTPADPTAVEPAPILGNDGTPGNGTGDKGTTEAAPASIDPENADQGTLDLQVPAADGATAESDQAAVPDSLQDTIYDAIDPCYEVDIWRFYAVAGQSVVISMNRTWGNLDSYIELYNPYGRFSAEDDDSGGYGNARLAGTIGTTGWYSIRAHSYASASTGGYTLSVTTGGGCSPCGGGGPVTAEQMWLADAYGNRHSSDYFLRYGVTAYVHVVVRNNSGYSQYTDFALDRHYVVCPFVPPCSDMWFVVDTGAATVGSGVREMVMAVQGDMLVSNTGTFRMRVTAGGMTSTVEYRD